MTEKKKLRLKKSIEVAPPSNESQIFSKKEGNKIVVHSKRKSQRIAPNTDASAHEQLIRKQKKLTKTRKKTSTTSIAVGIFIGILALVGTVLMIHYYNVKKLEAQTEAFYLREAQNAAEKILPQFAAPIEKLTQNAARADGVLSNASETVFFVTGNPLNQYVSSTARRLAFLKEQQAAAAEAEKVKEQQPDTPEPESIPEPEPEPREPPRVDGRDAPVGIDFHNGAPRRKRTPRAQTRPAPKMPKVATRDGRDAPAGIDFHRSDQGPASGSSVPQTGNIKLKFNKDPQVVTLAKKVKANRDKLHQNYRNAARLQTQAADIEYEAARTKTSPSAKKKLAAIQGLLEDVQDLVKTSDTELAALIRLGDDITREGHAEKKRRDDAAEAERQRREAEAYRALIARERNAVKQACAAVKPMIPEYDFDGAVSRLTHVRSQLKTKEAKTDMAPYLERMALLAKSKQDMIDNLNKARYRWGWGSGTTAVDIIGGDKQTLWLPTKKIPWKDVPFPQFTKLLKYYVDMTEERLSTRADRALAMAILYNESNMPEQSKASEALAIQLVEAIRDKAERLLKD